MKMFQFDLFSLFYDIIAYMVALRSLVDELLYKFGYKRRLDVYSELPLNLSDKVAVVTGGTRGLGLTVVRVLVSKGCSVFVATSQKEDKFPKIIDTIYNSLPIHNEEKTVKRGKVTLHYLDLSSMESVVEFVKAFKQANLNLNYLICNAGIMFAPRQLTVDNFESHLAVNYLGHCLLTLELLPELKRTADKTGSSSRIVNVSSSTHRITKFRFEDLLGEANYSSSQAYAQSKLAQIMFSAKLSKEIKNSLSWNNIQTFSLHPGVILSDLYEHVYLIKYFPFLKPLIRLVTRDVVQGAETTLYAALSNEVKDTSGVYLEDCDIKEPSKISLNEYDQDRLWEVTNRLLAPWATSDIFPSKKYS